MRLIAWLQLLFALGAPLGTVGAELSGVLRDNQGNGIGGITVSANIFLTEGSTQLVATTDSSGHFSMTGEPEWWRVDVSAAELNARGFFSVSAPSLSVTGHSVLRLTTRKLDFTHRIIGRLIDEAGGPLGSCSLRARIWENNALFETDLVTDTNGSFALAAVPALWSFCCLEAPTERVFGERLVEVEVTNVAKQVTFIAPAATATVSVNTSNLSGLDVVVSADAFGETFRLVQQVPMLRSSPSTPGIPTNTFRVFNGVWTIAVTNSDSRYVVQPGTLPGPVSADVTNGVVSVLLTSVTPPGATQQVQQVQQVRTVTASGQIVSNASVYASSASLSYVSPSPHVLPPGSSDIPGLQDLLLTEGHWRLTATIASSPDWTGWRVSRDVVINSNVAPPEVTLVFPDPDAGPRIGGTIRIPGGTGLASRSVSLRMTDGGTNDSINLVTDSLGRFGVPVVAGRWLVETYAGSGLLSSVVVVSNQDAPVDFDVLVPVTDEPVPVNVSLIEESGPSARESWFNMQSGHDYLTTNGAPSVAWLLRPGIWHASIQTPYYVGSTVPTAPYALFPSLTWYLSPGDATNLALATRQTSARIEGRLRDEQGRLLQTGYAAAWISVNGTNFWSYGSIASGYFSLNVFPGEWQVGASVSGYASVGMAENAGFNVPRSPDALLPTSYYTTPPVRWVRVSNDLVRCDFVTTNIPIQTLSNLRVTVVREDGGDVSGLSVSAYGLGGGESRATDENGVALLTVPPGPLTISARLDYDRFSIEPLFWPTLPFEITAPSNQVVLVVRQSTSRVCGTVSNAPAFGMQPQLRATAQLSGTNYSISGCPDSAGHYCLPALPGVWTVGIDDTMLDGYGIQSVALQNVTVPPTGQPASVDFVLSPVVGDFREAHLSSPVILPNGALQLELRGPIALTWRLERSDNLIDWMPFALGAVVNGSFVIQEPLAHSGKAAFYRAVWVR